MRSLHHCLRAALLLLAVAVSLPSAAQTVNARELIVLSTTTTQDSGILRVITDAFARHSGLEVKAIVAGSGDILRQGARGEGDVLLTHSPAAEQAWMRDGNGTARHLVMYNDFVVIGPASDPAQIRGQRAAEAFRRMAATQAPFVSRGDQSGTHVRELALWQRAGVAPAPQGQRWYRETGQGQGLTMDVAAQFQSYTLTDRGTYLVHARRIGMPILVENDPALFNIYHVMPVNAAKFPRVNAAGAQAFADWLLSPAAQSLIAEFGRQQHGRSLFVPAAGKRESDFAF